MGDMTALHIARLIGALALAAGLTVAPAPSPLATPPVEAASLPRWTGSVDLYRRGTFSTQQTYLWCTAANVQIARNIVHGQSDHRRTNQSYYFDWMRARNRYDIPVSDGVDPQGWAAGMRNFVDGRYRLAAFRSYTSALRSAVTSLRLTNLPVGVLVARGGHAWLLTGFSATADPAATREFTVTSVRVVGPLYGLQSRNGYDMPPNTSLSASAFKRFFTPWHYAGIRMVWEGLYGTIQGTSSNAGTVPQAARGLHPPVPALTQPVPSTRPRPTNDAAAVPSPTPSTDAGAGSGSGAITPPSGPEGGDQAPAVIVGGAFSLAVVAIVGLVILVRRGVSGGRGPFALPRARARPR
jgi:hypothetical protein